MKGACPNMSDYSIRIGLKERKLLLYRSDTVTGIYPVAVGKPATPTPTGQYTIQDKIINPGGILGTRWMGFFIIHDGEYGIHGNNNPASIGTAASLGCVRMFNEDVEYIFPLVTLGTQITVHQSLEEFKAPNSSLPGPSSEHATYVVQPGDSLWKLAKKFSTTVAALATLNNLTQPYLLMPGQAIKTP